MRFISTNLLIVTLCCFSSASLAETTLCGNCWDYDAKVYPGTNCRALYGAVPTATYGALFNSSNSWMYFDCPVVRDRTMDYIEYGAISIIDAHSTSDVSCYLALATVKYNGIGYSFSGYWNSTRSSLTHFDSKRYRIDLRQSKPSDHHAYIRCSVPPAENGRRSGIVSYKATEKWVDN